ncbi:MAG TPA: hypothetical protein VFB82_19200 [Blastocatellia bacterium]|nr:hypothetical protein [Blastocatellia bacterium]
MPGKESNTDTELVRQMHAARDSDASVEAVFILTPEDPSQIVPSPERTEALTRQLLERVKARIGKAAEDVNIFRNMGSFVVSAHPEFLREMIAQPEIASAMANQQTRAEQPEKKPTSRAKPKS